MDSKYTECLELNEIEQFILQQSAERFDTSAISAHLDSCSRCKQVFSELRIFYNILFDELKKPVTNQVFHLVKNLHSDDITVAGVLLKPQLLDEMPGERHFTSQIVFYESGTDEGEETVTINPDEVFIRVIKSNKTDKTTLYLSAENRKLYSDIIFRLPEHHISFYSDEQGKIEIGKFDIRDLDSRAVMIVSQR